MTTRIPGRYVFASQQQTDQGVVYGLFRPPTIDLTDSSTYTLTEKDVGRFDNLANQFYGDPTLWWVLAWANKIPDTTVVTPGTVIQVPTRDVVNKIYAQQQGTLP